MLWGGEELVKLCGPQHVVCDSRVLVACYLLLLISTAWYFYLINLFVVSISFHTFDFACAVCCFIICVVFPFMLQHFLKFCSIEFTSFVCFMFSFQVLGFVYSLFQFCFYFVLVMFCWLVLLVSYVFHLIFLYFSFMFVI